MAKKVGVIQSLAVAIGAAVMAMTTGCGLLSGGPKPVYTVNCGAAEAYVDTEGKKWAADQEMAEGADWGAVGGLTVLRELETIAGTPAPAVYLNERYSMTGYEFKVEPGTYTVRLHFAETYDGIVAAGERLFSVSINGEVKLKDLDVFSEAGGLNKPLIREFKGIEVTDGKLVIGFTANTQNAEINGIEILAE